MTSTSNREGTQVYRVYIKATPQAVWDAITKSEWTQKYGYGGAVEFDLRPGGKYRAFASEAMKAGTGMDVMVDGEVVEADPPRKLVQTWRPLWDPDIVKEGFKRLTWEIEEDDGGLTRVTLTHELEGAPKTAAQVRGTDARLHEGGGGWSWILSDLKTLLETGKSLEG